MGTALGLDPGGIALLLCLLRGNDIPKDQLSWFPSFRIHSFPVKKPPVRSNLFDCNDEQPEAAVKTNILNF
jgi:hypothetical protein